MSQQQETCTGQLVQLLPHGHSVLSPLPGSDGGRWPAFSVPESPLQKRTVDLGEAGLVCRWHPGSSHCHLSGLREDTSHAHCTCRRTKCPPQCTPDACVKRKSGAGAWQGAGRPKVTGVAPGRGRVGLAKPQGPFGPQAIPGGQEEGGDASLHPSNLSPTNVPFICTSYILCLGTGLGLASYRGSEEGDSASPHTAQGQRGGKEPSKALRSPEQACMEEAWADVGKAPLPHTGSAPGHKLPGPREDPDGSR